MRTLDVVGIGSMVVDRVHRSRRILGSDEKGILQDVESSGPVRSHVGGVVLNHLGWAATLGLRTGIFGRQADDEGGRFLRDAMNRFGIERDLLLDGSASSVAEIFVDDQSLIDFVQRAMGYSLTGETTEQCLLLLHGSGSNGKGVLTRTLMRVLGDYAWNVPFTTMQLREHSGIPNDLASLVGRRFVIASELNDGAQLNEARVKALTGCDSVPARFLHAEFFTFEPVAKFWLSVNHKPIVRDDSYGFWRRIRLIPFLRQFPKNDTLEPALRAEASGVLAWAIRGCLQWQTLGGLAPPSVVTEATAEYARESDP